MMVSIDDLRAAKRLSMSELESLSPSDRRNVLPLLGRMHEYHDDLATHTAFANGRIERLREALRMALANESNWHDEARAILLAVEL